MQRQFTAIRLNINHSIHLGSHREEYDRSDSILHSDSLYSAIIAAWAVLEVDHPILSYEGTEPPDLGFTISSLFPFFRKSASSEPVYFFPVPKPGMPESDANRYRDVKWLDVQAFEHYLRHGKINSSSNICGDYITTHPEFERSKTYQNFMLSEVQPRAYVPRTHEADTETEIFYIERIFFREYCGLFGLVIFDDEEIKSKVSLALDYLKDAGIGTDRNVGHGQFEYEMDEFEHFNDLPNSDHAINLSMFLPENESQLTAMLDSKHCCYNIVKRGGWITTEGLLSYRKNSVYMFGEGGVFKTKQRIAGNTIDLRPEIIEKITPVLRTGSSIFLPLNI